MKKNSKFLTIIFFIALNIFIFQNCSQQGFKSELKNSNSFNETNSSSQARYPTNNLNNLNTSNNSEIVSNNDTIDSIRMNSATSLNINLPLQNLENYKCLSSTDKPPVLPTHIKYFGHYFSLTLPKFNLNFSDWASRLLEMKNQGNFTTIQYLPPELLGSDSIAEKLFIDKLAFASSHGWKVSLELSLIFFAPNSRLDAIDLSQLRSDYLNRWKRIKNLIQPYQSAIAVFYPLDEPFWNASMQNVSAKLIIAHLETINTVLKSDFPSTPIAFVEAYKMVDSNLIIPKGFDWIGMDCYGSFEKCGDSGIEKSIPDYYQILKSKMNSNQRLIAIPEGFVSINAAITEEDALVKRTKKYLDYISTEPLFILVANFIYHGEPDYRATRDICSIRELFHWYFNSRRQESLNTVNASIKISCPSKIQISNSKSGTGTCTAETTNPHLLNHFYWTVNKSKELGSDNYTSYTWYNIIYTGVYNIQAVGIDNQGHSILSNLVPVDVSK